MTLKELKPRKALNKAFLKVKPNRTEIEGFKNNLITLLDRTNDTESEEFHKNLVSDFLKDTYYKQNHFINTKGRNDLVIHNGQNANSTVGVILEAKKPTNKVEMITTKKLNAKAFQELVLYYLRERITHKNLEVKHLVATNINEWFIFDATLFDRLFAQNKNLVKQFNDFEAGRLADTKTDFFYKQVAEPFIAGINSEIEFTYFNIQDFQKPLRNADKADDNALIALFKLLSPEHLLKLPFTNDSNSLDKRFYSELLHIIGLTETKEGSKKLIQRNKEGERNTGSLLEDAIIQLDSLDKLSRLEKPNQYGNTQQERLFNVALELSITWINRILFLKLLEAQLITYHKGDKSYSFLNLDKIKNYDDLNSLFFQVLARKYEERNEDVKRAFEKVPYLNSSLFEPTDIEQMTLFISNLKDDKTIPIYSQTVLKDRQGKKRTGSITTHQYLFEFLDAYDFGAEGGSAIQEDNKTLINASVLGLIFEKINGYKDGSFFTPGFITMYMCRETIRKAVVQKFNETKKWNCTTLEELYDKIEDRKEANQIVNSIKICDPAVGSGHFLVSALNEMIAIKNDLKILQDCDGKRLKEYQVEVVNDELIVTDEEGELFEYNPTNSSTGSLLRSESQRIQETLFHEKQTLIENCLFGVDINSNSVKICRLRLWIELLKNAYYKNSTELETLPNIDINIKCGNSLVSRFAIDADLKQALKKSKWTIDSYRIAVDTYRNAESKEQKREMERLIADIKSDFRSEISLNDPKVKKLRKLSGDLYQMTNQGQLFEMSKKEKADWNKKVTQLTEEIKKLETEIEEIKANKIFENAFEWRFEFPEVLNDDGDFVGFDVVIGNPPYGAELNDSFKVFLKDKYTLYHTRWTDTFNYFIGLSIEISKNNSGVCLIIPNNFLFQNEYEKSRRKVIEQNEISKVINLGDGVFADAEVPTCIILISKNNIDNDLIKYTDLRKANKNENLFVNVNYTSSSKREILESTSVSFSADKIGIAITKRKIDSIVTIDTIADEVANGIQPTGDKIFRLSPEKVIELGIESAILKKVLTGSDFNKYVIHETEYKIIYATKEIDIKMYPKCLNYLQQFKEQLSKKRETIKGTLPWWCLHWPRYKGLFEDEKIIFRQTSDTIICTYDVDGFYAMNTVLILKLKQEFKDTFPYKFLIGILNSRLINYFYKQITQEENRVFAEVKPINIRKLPIIKCSSEEQKNIISIVDTVLSIKKQNPSADTTDLENQIDQLVYQLYDLTEEEINIIQKTEQNG
ncbi:MAG: N-6 DNA methylase [Flavobacteriales bacterium]|nr:N-6 DNA methylase [Flavobacteriales bacterium]